MFMNIIQTHHNNTTINLYFKYICKQLKEKLKNKIIILNTLLKKNNINFENENKYLNIHNICGAFSQIDIKNNLADFKNIFLSRKKLTKDYISIFNIAYTWTDCWSLAYYVRSQFSRGIGISSIFYGIKKSIPLNVTGLCIQVTGRITGAPRASKKKYVFGSCSFSAVSNNMQYAFLKMRNRFGISSVKIWINF